MIRKKVLDTTEFLKYTLLASEIKHKSRKLYSLKSIILHPTEKTPYIPSHPHIEYYINN